MAAEVTIKTILELTGLGNEEILTDKFTSGTTPVETIHGKALTGTTATSLDLGDIAAGKGYILYLNAVVGNFYIKLGATTGTPVLTDSHLYILEGESYPIPINPNATAMPGIRFIGSSASSVLEYLLVGGA